MGETPPPRSAVSGSFPQADPETSLVQGVNSSEELIGNGWVPVLDWPQWHIVKRGSLRNNVDILASQPS